MKRGTSIGFPVGRRLPKRNEIIWRRWKGKEEVHVEVLHGRSFNPRVSLMRVSSREVG